ncbi:hypothetical protein AGMMS50268_14700 [Spirochaetia bacterium]|nr:hypothetical protein AGMMS50268_14700 [Spirochaetia bacterium]
MIKKQSVVFVLLTLLTVQFSFADAAGELLVRAAREGNESLLRNVLGSANVNYLDNERTALMEACDKQNLPLVKLLLEEGKANPSFKNAYQQTALMFAAQSNINADIVNLLVSRNANINDADSNGDTVLMYAARNQSPQVIDLLIRRGVNINRTNVNREDALIVATRSKNRDGVTRLITASGAINWSQTDINGNTAFMIACNDENLELVRLFLTSSTGFDANLKTNGVPPLLWLIDKQKSWNVIRYLIEQTDSLNARDDFGRDAYYYANLRGNKQATAALDDKRTRQDDGRNAQSSRGR